MLHMPQVSFAFEAIGTAWMIEIYEPLAADRQAELLAAIETRTEEFDRAYSRFRPDSLVAEMSRVAGKYELPDDAKPMLEFYKSLYEATGGLVTPLVGQSLAEAGYDAQYSLKPGKVSAPPAWDDVLVYDHPQLEVKRPVLLDFGAAGKGYLADIVARLIQGAGVTQYSVDAGGDIVAQVLSPLAVGLEHPEDPSLAVGVAHAASGSLCGSSGNRRAWGEYHHILNPQTLESPRHIAALWVYAATGLEADGLATALFFVQPETLKRRYNFEYAIVKADMSLEYSKGFPAEFF